ncbi:hypothetical protein DFH08DRAFT_956175 [Mycena albidolilacea]|uniref:CxC2-like cysteine cluster KDZ transposase-associated domain-containing protein n=1 Tax=Mycena albidolilacea TaxID=1033008 RepID=A0AAD7AAJ2_9AGAR|nr:hypothetical protein DFH08DRAFT_956175 [Mycena albidolilacea]
MAPGECALLCPPCPHPGKNLPPDWVTAPPEKQFLYALFVAMGTNFRLKRKDVLTEEKDPGLNKGWVFFCEVVAYMKHVKANWNQKQERSHGIAHDAVNKPDCVARGTASSVISMVNCVRHNMKHPNAVGDLQLGERYMNMDYIFFKSLAGTELVRLFVSYNIACQWHINIWIQMAAYANKEITINGRGKFFIFLVPKFHLLVHIKACNLKFSFNLTRDIGQTDGEAPEHGWYNANPLVQKHEGDGAWIETRYTGQPFSLPSYIVPGSTFSHKMKNTVPEMVKTQLALSDLEESVGPEPLKEWMAMAELWDEDADTPNPFETQCKDEHLVQVWWELAAEAAKKEQEGTKKMGNVRGDMHITELLLMGLQLEEQQRTLVFDAGATGLHPMDDQRRAMIKQTRKLHRKIFAWIEVQNKFFSGLSAIWDLEDKAHETLDEVWYLLLVRTHLYKLKDAHTWGVRANMQSADKIAALNDHIKRGAAGYRAARKALVVLGRTLKRRE